MNCKEYLYSWANLCMKPQCATIQMKAIEQYFHVVLFITLYNVVLTSKSVDETPVLYFQLVLFVMLYKVVLTFQSVDESPVCDHSNESYWAVWIYFKWYCISYFTRSFSLKSIDKNLDCDQLNELSFQGCLFSIFWKIWNFDRNIVQKIIIIY